MAGTGLHDPLGTGRRPEASRSGWVRYGPSLALAAAVLGLALFVVLRDDGQRGEPFAVATLQHAAPPEPAPAPAPPAPAASALPPPSAGGPESAALVQGGRTGSADGPSAGLDVTIENGVKIVRSRTGRTGGLVIKVPDETPTASLPITDTQLIEQASFGPIPRIGADGRRPADVYARAAPDSGRPKIALVVGGLGLNRAATAEAIRALAPAVTLGFAPFGEEVEAAARSARAAGHEIILQVPMEGAGPASPAVSHLLVTGQPGNLERLHWMMSRFGAYAGIQNHLGARFLADPASLRPVLADIAARGLYFIDDGSSPSSLAPDMARGLGLPVAKADIALDRAAGPDLAKALSQLEDLARARGAALGVASALPETVSALAQFTNSAQSRGFAIVPVSALLARHDVAERQH